MAFGPPNAKARREASYLVWPEMLDEVTQGSDANAKENGQNQDDEPNSQNSSYHATASPESSTSMASGSEAQ